MGQRIDFKTSSMITLSILPPPNPAPYGYYTFAKLNGPSTEGDISSWYVETDGGEGIVFSATVRDNFFNACGGWDHIFQPWTSTQPSGMYFYFGLQVTVLGYNGKITGNSTFYVGQGGDGTRYPWWAGGADFAISGNHTHGTLTVANANKASCTNVTATVFESQNSNDVHEIDLLFRNFATS